MDNCTIRRDRHGGSYVTIEADVPHGASQPLQPAAHGPAGEPGRLRRWLIILGCALLILAGLGYAGYRYLLTTEWGVFLTLFADDERAENFRTMDDIFPSRDIAAGASVRELDRDERELPASYDVEGERHDLDAFLERTETTGLVVLHDGTLVHEQYREGYDATFADINMIFVRAMGFGEPMLDYYASLERVREPGTFNDYVSSDAGVLAAVVAAATGQPVADYLEAEVWQPAGMEGDAFWSLDRTDAEIGFCCVNAQLRDYARFGQLYLDDGVRDGQRILPEGWVEASTNPEAPRLEPGDNPDSSWTFGYGYQWWIPEGRVNGEFTAIGVWGQYVYVDPTNGVVIAKSSTDGAFDDNDHESIAAFRAIAEEVAR